MPKTKISEYSTTNSNNTDIESINIDEGCAPSGINNAIRELMVHLKEFQTGSSGDPLTVAGGFVASGGFTSNTMTVTGILTASGGTILSSTNTLSGSNIISGNINSSGTTNTFSGGNILSGTNTFSGTNIFSSDVTLNAQSDLRFADSDSSNWVAFQSPATVASNVTWTLPSADGTSNQALVTNGSGTLSWATAGSSQWTTTGSDIYYNTGNVAVGSTSVVASTGKSYQLGSNVLLQNVVNSQMMLSQNAVYDSTWKYITANRAAAIRFGAQNDGEISIHYSNAVGTAGGTISNWDANKSMVITQTGQVLVGPTSAQSGGCNFQVSQGITFPATQSASSDANTLDDYEEGTWTPSQQNFSVSGTTTITGTYTKIGRVVYFNVAFANTGTIAFSTSCLITLPFSGVFQSGMVAMCLESNSESQTSGKSGVQMSIDAVNSRFFVGNFTTTSAGQTLHFGGFYRVS
jgi:hypothetical protein